ncbi:hypothetical protein N0V90_006983 [Kalmusia sp. IMI 367209]|nr:hypothetical protein N0V90_006983 [Kalmusia sp. IMI 367209]
MFTFACDNWLNDSTAFERSMVNACSVPEKLAVEVVAIQKATEGAVHLGDMNLRFCPVVDRDLDVEALLAVAQVGLEDQCNTIAALMILQYHLVSKSNERTKGLVFIDEHRAILPRT